MKKVAMKGTEYNVQDVVPLVCNDVVPKFGTIQYMLHFEDNPKQIYFLLQELVTVTYDSHYHAYEVQQGSASIICQQEAFLDHQPLVVNVCFDRTVHEKRFVRVRYVYVP